jgi:hypothetical protein
MHQIHKELLVQDLVEKANRVQNVAKRRQDFIRNAQSKNTLIRDIVCDTVKKEDSSLKPITYDDRYAEWKVDVKRQKKNKPEDK